MTTQTAAFVQWGYEYLSSHGYTLKSDQPEMVQDTPWSCVVRFVASDGYIYLKQTPSQLALEAIITHILRDQFHANVPEVIAFNSELNCFLMKDAGRILRGILKEHFDTELLCKAIDQFTFIQLDVADHVNVFLEIGVPDWRLDKLPALYKHLLAQKDILIADGLSEIEINALEALYTKVANLCQNLSDYAIKQSFVQCDFQDNNILIDNISQDITFIDLGEIVISHPFFSLVGCLRQAKLHHALTEEDDAYLQLMNACLKNFMSFGSKKDISDAFAIAQTLWMIYESLAQYRLLLACDKTRFLSFQRHGRLSGRLKELVMALQV